MSDEKELVNSIFIQDPANYSDNNEYTKNRALGFRDGKIEIRENGFEEDVKSNKVYIINKRNILAGRNEEVSEIKGIKKEVLKPVLATETNKRYNMEVSGNKSTLKEVTGLNRGSPITNDGLNVLQYRNEGNMFGGRNKTDFGDTTPSVNFVYNGGSKKNKPVYIDKSTEGYESNSDVRKGNIYIVDDQNVNTLRDLNNKEQKA